MRTKPDNKNTVRKKPSSQAHIAGVSSDDSESIDDEDPVVCYISKEQICKAARTSLPTNTSATSHISNQ